MPEELEELLDVLENTQEEQRGAFTLYRGTLDGQAVLLAECGVGKVNAAALTQLFVMQEVERVIFTGVAGAVDPTLKVGDIIVSTDALQHDSDVTRARLRAWASAWGGRSLGKRINGCVTWR